MANYCHNGFVKVRSTKWLSTLEILHCSLHHSLLFSCILTLSRVHPLFNWDWIPVTTLGIDSSWQLWDLSNDAQIPKVQTTSFGIEETITYLGSKLWQLLPQEIKQSNTLPIFKKRIKCWRGGECNCRLCKTYMPQVGFLTG